MTHNAAIKVVLKLITLILEHHQCKISKNGGNWTCQFANQSEVFNDQLEAVLHGCGLVIPNKGGLL